jgi:hypothetical protein
MWTAQQHGQLYTLVIPDASEQDQQQAIAYLDWLLHELDGIARVRVHYRPSPEGHICFALEDETFNDTTSSSEEAAP